jgi:hypothetical protein
MRTRPGLFSVSLMAAALLAAGSLLCAVENEARSFGIATFSVDVTIPMGHPCMGGGITPAREIMDPLFAKGFVLTGAEKPFVVVSFDWCEIRGTSFEKWKRGLADAAGTEPLDQDRRKMFLQTTIGIENAGELLLDLRQRAAKEELIDGRSFLRAPVLFDANALSGASGAFEADRQFLDIKWFRQIVGRPQPHGFDGTAHTALGGHHDHARRRTEGLVSQEVRSEAVREVDVQQGKINRHGLGGGRSFGDVFRLSHLGTGMLQKGGDALPEHRLIVENQNGNVVQGNFAHDAGQSSGFSENINSGEFSESGPKISADLE